MKRSTLLDLAGAAPIAPPATAQPTAGRMHRRKIPSSGEMLPVVGCGTWRSFDVGATPQDRAPLAEVLRILFEADGSVIDSSPMYGAAEGVVGDLLATDGTRDAPSRDRGFIATKVWTSGRESGIAQMRQSMRLFRTERIDLMQVHNLVDWRTHLPTLRAWKQEGRLRYLGVTHYTRSAHAELAAVLRAERWDFVQIDYALDDRAVERSVLPLAAERGVAVIVNQPFGGGGLLRRLMGRKLPGWAAEIGCASWAQILLKFVLTHQAVTCVIPGTGKPEHMKDNVQAGFGAYPDAALLKRMVAEASA